MGDYSNQLVAVPVLSTTAEVVSCLAEITWLGHSHSHSHSHSQTTQPKQTNYHGVDTPLLALGGI